MAYYIINFESERMKSFQKRFSFLADAVWIQGKDVLSKGSENFHRADVYFVPLIIGNEEVDEVVLEIRHKFPNAKIIYAADKSQLKQQSSHRLTPVGGDGYFSLETGPAELGQFLDEVRVELSKGMVQISASKGLEDMSRHPKSLEMNRLFEEVFKRPSKPVYQKANNLSEVPLPDEVELGDLMSDKDQELSLDDLGELELSDEPNLEMTGEVDSGLELSLDDAEINLGDDLSEESDELDIGEFDEVSLEDSEQELSLSDDTAEESFDEIPELNLDQEDASDIGFGVSEELSLDAGPDDGNSLGDEADLNLSDDLSADLPDFDLGSAGGDDLSDDARKKLEEIDALMVSDASQVAIGSAEDGAEDSLLSASEDEEIGDLGMGTGPDINQPLVSDDLDLASISFTGEEEQTSAPAAKINKKKMKEAPASVSSESAGNLGREFKEVAAAYTGEMERLQATLSNLRADREELLAKIQKHEEEKILQSRQMLTLRAELDEKKIELSIIRKKLNDEITELKDRLKLHEERKLILEEKNKVLMTELDKAAQKNKIDVKKVQMRERELEQKLELLKADTDLQIRNRDQKILELKRKIDSMEFDMESISMQEKRSVESRFELEDKLDKAIKTLRSAISVLEDENEKSSALEALKKNIDM